MQAVHLPAVAGKFAKHLSFGRLLQATALSFFGAALLTSVGAAASDVSAPSHKVYFTAEERGKIPGTTAAKQFTCSDQVFTVLEASNYAKGDYDVIVTWTDPAGRERERTKYQFHPRAETTRVWSWLKLHRGAGAVVMSIFDSSAGLDGFVGEWTVQVAVNGKLLEKNTFEVLC